MNTESQNRIVLVSVDHSEIGRQALGRALDLATSAADVELHVLRVVPRPTAPNALPSQWQPSFEDRCTLSDQMENALRSFLAEHPGRERPAQLVCHFRIEELGGESARLAEELGADLVTIQDHRIVVRPHLASHSRPYDR